LRHFCTYFDRNYLLQGLSLYRSLAAHAGDGFVLWVLCFDDGAYDVLMKLGIDNLRPVSLSELERGDEALQKAKRNRSPVEYYFTCSPSWPLYLLDRFPDIGMITYLDADLMFFSSPAPIYEEMGDNSVLIVGHRFPPHLRHLENRGIYNVGIVAFRNDERGRACLSWWRERCLEWCFERLEEGRYADQKYLDDWPARFPGVAVLQLKGAGLAPWNCMNYRLEVVDDKLTADGCPLVFYHFHGVKIINRWMYDPWVINYGEMPDVFRRWLYPRYFRLIQSTRLWLRERLPSLEPAFPALKSRYYSRLSFLKRLLKGNIAIDWEPVER
jgi:hypothetical protein